MPRTPMFPFSDRKSDIMQKRIVDVIRNPQFVFELPSLSPASWDIILNDSQRRERLEFLGDALIGASISEELFRCWPNEGPGFYTKARSVLTANSTFAHIMLKLGFHNMTQPVKPTGDAFETILAAYHKEQGPEAFNQYVRQNFLPLVTCIGQSYHDSRPNEVQARKTRVQLQQKQHQLSSTAHFIKASKAHRRPTQHNKLVNVKNNIQRSLQRQLPPSHARPLQVPAQSIPMIASNSSKKPAKATTQAQVVVDLTADSDNDDPTVQVRPLSVTKPGSSVGNPKPFTNHVRTPNRSGLQSVEGIKSHISILRSILTSPQVSKAAGTKLPLTHSSRNNTRIDQDGLAVLLSQTSLLNLPGSANNPISID